MSHIADLIVIGAGPAGLSAAVEAAQQGWRVIVLDEFPQPGGRILGQFHEEPGHGWWIGRHIATQLVDRANTLGVIIRCGTSVHSVQWNEDAGTWIARLPDESLTGRYLLLATGAAEVPTPVPGWTLPGVMSIGAAQVLTNVHYVKPGQRGLIIGVNVLSMAIARELSVSGVSLAGIVLPPSSSFATEAAQPASVLHGMAKLAHLAPTPLLRAGGRLIKSPSSARLAARLLPRSGLKIWDIPLLLRTATVSINGREQVESVTVVDLDGRGGPLAATRRDLAVDFVALAGGLYPLAELAAVLGCPFVYVDELGGHVPVHDEQLRTPIPRLHVAGSITGVESAQVAIAQGALAATSICADAGCFGLEGEARVREAIGRVRAVRAAALIQFHPRITAARERLYADAGIASQAPTS